MTELWVSIEDVARHLGVVRESIYRWIKDHNLPAHRVGRHWKFKLSEIDRWVQRGGGNKLSSRKRGSYTRKRV